MDAVLLFSRSTAQDMQQSMTAVQHGTFAFDFIPATFVLPAEYSLMQVCAIPSAMLCVVWYQYAI
jgi:hypothetical protein